MLEDECDDCFQGNFSGSLVRYTRVTRKGLILKISSEVRKTIKKVLMPIQENETYAQFMSVIKAILKLSEIILKKMTTKSMHGSSYMNMYWKSQVIAYFNL